MKLQGKFKTDFFEWLSVKMNTELAKDRFDCLPQSAQFGLLQEYCDSVGIIISNGYYVNQYNQWQFDICQGEDDYIFPIEQFDSRQEAQVQAIEKAQLILNK